MRKAFTLIELLIVVAIIAILAAIAVPNFLEAQVRAKVSRSRADMRSVATAIESYTVDHNTYPLDPEERSILGVAGGTMGALAVLTTPVSYISNLPTNPFTALGGETAQAVANSQYTTLRPMYDYWAARNNPPALNPTNRWASAYSAQSAIDCLSAGYFWILYCFGPSRTNVRYDLGGGWTMWPPRVIQHVGIPIYIYDPTNGTTSLGLIMRTNKGEVDGSSLIYK